MVLVGDQTCESVIFADIEVLIWTEQLGVGAVGLLVKLLVLEVLIVISVDTETEVVLRVEAENVSCESVIFEDKEYPTEALSESDNEIVGMFDTEIDEESCFESV